RGARPVCRGRPCPSPLPRRRRRSGTRSIAPSWSEAAMRAVILRVPGGAENLKLEETPDPSPGAGEVVVRLKAAALNHRDVWIRSGTGAYAGGFKQRVILGSDGAGDVSAAGAGADSARVGRAVVINPSLDWGDDHAA